MKPKSGTTALLKYDLPMTSRDFCIALLEEEGVMLCPGSAFDLEGMVRMGYACGTERAGAGPRADVAVPGAEEQSLRPWREMERPKRQEGSS